MNVSLDVESTLADISTPFRDEYERRHGVRPGVWTEWDFTDADFTFSEFMAITGSNWKNRIHAIEPTEVGIMSKLYELQQLTTSISIVTGRSGFDRQIQAWLDTQGIIYDNYVVVNSQEEKAELGYQILIDDCPKHVEYIQNDQTFLLYDQPYNQHIDTQSYDNVTRINSLGEAISKIEFLHLYA